MSDFVAIFKDEDGDMKTHCFLEESTLYSFLNTNSLKASQGEYDEDSGEEIKAYVIMDKFPVPPKDWSKEARVGEYCISAHWPEDGLIIFTGDGNIFVPTKELRSKTISVVEYGPAVKAKTRSRKAPTKRSRK